MPTLVNNLRAIRGPVTAVPMVGQSGVVVEPDTVNNQVVVRADETVLWENESSPLQTTGGTAALSEAASNFKYLRFEYRGEQGSGYGLKTQTIANDNRLDSISLGGLAQFYDNYAFSFTGAHVSISGTTLTLVRQGRFNVNDNDTISATDHGNNLFRLVRVVGINRIANN